MAVEAPAVAAADRAPMPGRKVRRRKSLRTRIALWTGVVCLTLLLLLTVVVAGFARHVVLDDAQNEVRASTLEAAQRLDGTLRMVTVTANGIADTVANGALEPDELTALMRAMIAATPGATGGLLALEPVRPGEAHYVHYVAVNGEDRDFVAIGYRYKAQRWYQRTLAAQQGWWAEPYYNETAGGVWMTTYNLPVRRARGDSRARGMISIDMPVDTLAAEVETLANLPGWRLALTAPDGLLAMHPEVGVALHRNLPDYIARFARSDLARAAEAVHGRQRIAYLHADPRNGTRWFTAIEPVGDSGWVLAVSKSYAQILGELYRVLTLVLAASLIVALLSMFAVGRLARQISRPIEDLSASASHLANGEYDYPVPHGERDDEVGLLANTLDHARTSIQRQLVEIGEMSAAQQKLESELAIAHDIQLSMLPPPKTLARGTMRLDAHAMLEPAKAVGGDFYSFIERGGELWFAIGDVSDKGVPAALFMARTATVLEVAVRTSDSPAAALAEASRRLVDGNDACMFATVLCGRIDVHDGACELASAGHDPPLLLHAGDGTEQLHFEGGPPLGVDVCDAFPSWRGRLLPGDSLVAWTDGVTEAFDAGNEAFGEDRLLAALQPGYSARDNCARLIAEVHAFAAGAAQSDDITALAIRLRGDAPANDDLKGRATC